MHRGFALLQSDLEARFERGFRQIAILAVVAAALLA